MDYLYEDDIDDVDDDEESNYGNWNKDEDCDVDNDDDNESSELMIDEDDTSSNNNTNNNPVKHNTNSSSSRNVTPTPTPTPANATPLSVVSETHQQNKALKLLSINDSLVPGQNSVINNGLAKFNFKIIENSNDERQQFKEMKNSTLSSFTTDSLNSNSKQQRRSRNSSLCIDNANNAIASSIKQQQPPQPIENFNGINFSKSLISQINSGAANLNATIQSLNSSGTGTKCNLLFLSFDFRQIEQTNFLLK